MGREIRRVPPQWDHPVTERQNGQQGYQPMFDRTYEQACAEWLADFDRIRNGGAKGYEIECYPGGVCHWASENIAPEPSYYRPWEDDEATWWQLWETVSEGTPVSPPFETDEDLICYLAEHGDFWDQRRCHEPGWVTLWGGMPGVSGWGRDRAEKFVRGAGWAPSMVVDSGQVKSGVNFVNEND